MASLPPQFCPVMQNCEKTRRPSSSTELIDRAHRPKLRKTHRPSSSTAASPASNQKTARTKTERTRRKNRKRDRASTHLARCSARANALTIRIKKSSNRGQFPNGRCKRITLNVHLLLQAQNYFECASFVASSKDR